MNSSKFWAQPARTQGYSTRGLAGRLFCKYFKSLIEKPIVRTRQSITKRFAAQFTLVVPDFSNVDKDYLDQNAIPKNAVFWRILVLPIGYDLTGPLAITEGPANFELH
jgi:hypothetical protein